jgi:predicted CXXCH cytochrome family protein
MTLFRRHAGWIAAGLFFGTIAVVATLAIIAFGLRDPGGYIGAEPSPTPEPSMPLMGSDLGGVFTEDCLGCHVTEDGTIGLNPVPALAHPLEGWSECTECHAPSRLVQTAPGHDGVHAGQCLSCHKESTAEAPPRPHPPTQSQDCLSCHGSTAPLPPEMAERPENACFICHQSSSLAAPHFLHRLSPDQPCTDCHQPGEAGTLPASHDGRTDETCVTCHGAAEATGAPEAPHELARRAGMCAFCHQEAVAVR